MVEQLKQLLREQLSLLRAAARVLEEGTPLDRLQRAEARGLITSAERWRELRMLRNSIAHDYLIESADKVLHDALAASPELIDTAQRVVQYVGHKGYC